MAFYKSPSKSSEKGKGTAGIEDEEDLEKSSDDTSDEGYKQLAEEDNSAEDEEAIEFRQYARQIKTNIRAKKLGIHGSQDGVITAEDLFDEVPNLDEPSSP